MALRNWLRSRSANHTRRTAPRPRLGVQQLESREVPASLQSALGVGNDSGPTSPYDIAADAAGNTYVTGTFEGTVDFDPAAAPADGSDVLTARGNADAFVAKCAPDNALVWVRRMGGDGLPSVPHYTTTDSGRRVAVDAGGNVYVVGTMMETRDFGGFTLTSAGGRDVFVVKLDPTGAVRWANRSGVATDDLGTGVGLDAAGNVYVRGGRDVGVAEQNGFDVLKYSPSGGQPVWSRWVNTRMSGVSGDLAVGPDGNTYVSGSFSGTVDFDPGSKTRSVYAGGGAYSGYVLKLTAAGNFGWVSPFVSQYDGTSYGYSTATNLALDASRNVLVGGVRSRQIDFNPGAGTTTLPGIGGAYFVKLTQTGGLAWVRGLAKSNTSGATSPNVAGLATDAAGNVYATGGFRGSVDFDPGAGTATRTSVRNAADTADSEDTYVLKLSASGTFQGVDTFGGAGDDAGRGIAVDPTGLIHLAGYFSGTADFDPDPLATHELTAPGTASNMYLVRLRQG